jgi:hypothetical protein
MSLLIVLALSIRGGSPHRWEKGLKEPAVGSLTEHLPPEQIGGKGEEAGVLSWVGVARHWNLQITMSGSKGGAMGYPKLLEQL